LLGPQNVTISYYLPEEGNISIDIFDLTGNKIISLINNQNISEGKHIFVWDGKNYKGKKVGTGLYFCKILINNNPFVVKMIKD